MILGCRSELPLMLSPTAVQRAFHWQGETAVAKAAEKFGLWFGISSLATRSIEEIAALTTGPKLFQLYVHKDKGLNSSMIERCQASGFDALALTVDTIVSGKRERCLRSGFTTPPRFTPASVWSYATRPRWTLDYLLKEKFRLPNLDTHARSIFRPLPFDRPYPLDHNLIVMRVRATMERHTHSQSCTISRRKEQSVRAEVIKSNSLDANCREHSAKGTLAQQLPWQKMVALQLGIKTSSPATIDRSKRQQRPSHCWSKGLLICTTSNRHLYSIATRTNLRLLDGFSTRLVPSCAIIRSGD